MNSPIKTEGIQHNTAFGGRSLLMVIVISLAGFMGTLDVTIVNIALPTMANYFQVSTSMISWVVLIYLLVLCSFTLTFGKCADRSGYKKIFLIGFVVFLTGSFLCGISGSLIHLLVFRVVQALGAAMLSSVGAAMVAVYLPRQHRAKGLSVITVMSSAGLAAGPVIGGFLTEYLGWNWIFFVNIPVALCAIVFGYLVLPFDQPTTVKEPFDNIGTLLFLVVLSSGLFALNMGMQLGWNSLPIIGGVLLCGACLVIFVKHERRCLYPMINLSLFTSRDFGFANLASALVMAAYAGIIFLLPFYLEYVKELSTSMAGLVLLAPSLAMVAGGPVAGILADKYRARPICIIVTVLFALAFFLFSTYSVATSQGFILVSLVLMGVAVGMFITANSTLVLGYSPKGEQGVVSGLMMTIRNTGSSVGIALFQVTFAVVAYGMAARETIASTALQTLVVPLIVEGFQMTCLGGSVLLIIALLFSWFARDAPQPDGE